MSEFSSNKTIAKNTLFLYFRMMLTMCIGIYTSRLILDVLGVDDYGIYQIVGGVVGMMAFLNGALATGSSRFLTFELGKREDSRISEVFNTAFNLHIILALIIFLAAESVGLWFLYNKLIIPPERLGAAAYAYELSVISVCLSVALVPFGAIVMSHERMKFYAYMSIIDVCLKLGIVYLLVINPWDNLVVYSTLFFLMQIVVTVINLTYCKRNFAETKYRRLIDKKITKEILGYSGWNLWANTAIALSAQGTVIMINMFFSPAVVVARSLANQVNGAASQFMGNFRAACNPQIVKRYAAGEYESSRELLLSTTKYSYFLLLLLGLPIILVSDKLLDIWLVEVPEYTGIFLRLTIITSFFQCFDSSLYTALYAKGQIRENALTSPMVLFLAFPVIYWLFRSGYSPVSLAWVILVVYAIIGLIVKPILIVKIVKYPLKVILKMFWDCLIVTLVAVPIPIVLYYTRAQIFRNEWIEFFGLAGISALCVCAACWFIGLDSVMRSKLLGMLYARFHRTATA